MNRLSRITEKIIKSQSEDLALALDEWNKAVEDVDLLKTQLEITETLARKAQEEVAAYIAMRQRLRFASYVEIGLGAPCLILGCLPIWTPEQQNIRNLLLGIGGTSFAAGRINFSFTIKF